MEVMEENGLKGQRRAELLPHLLEERQDRCPDTVRLSRTQRRGHPVGEKTGEDFGPARTGSGELGRKPISIEVARPTQTQQEREASFLALPASGAARDGALRLSQCFHGAPLSFRKS